MVSIVNGGDYWDTMTEIEHPPHNLKIRTFKFEQDMQKVLDLWTHAGPGVQLSRSDQTHEIRKKLKNDPDLFVVAELGDVLIGAVLGGYDGRRGMVYHLAVVNEYRNGGVGKVLMQELEDRLRSKGCLKYYLLVTKQNQEALGFYKKIGCQVMDMYLLGKEIA
jgi:ribosomal protein S18 acetylase RimI-like enzyme